MTYPWNGGVWECLRMTCWHRVIKAREDNARSCPHPNPCPYPHWAAQKSEEMRISFAIFRNQVLLPHIDGIVSLSQIKLPGWKSIEMALSGLTMSKKWDYFHLYLCLYLPLTFFYLHSKLYFYFHSFVFKLVFMFMFIILVFIFISFFCICIYIWSWTGMCI